MNPHPIKRPPDPYTIYQRNLHPSLGDEPIRNPLNNRSSVPSPSILSNFHNDPLINNQYRPFHPNPLPYSSPFHHESANPQSVGQPRFPRAWRPSAPFVVSSAHSRLGDQYRPTSDIFPPTPQPASTPYDRERNVGDRPLIHQDDKNDFRALRRAVLKSFAVDGSPSFFDDQLNDDDGRSLIDLPHHQWKSPLCGGRRSSTFLDLVNPNFPDQHFVEDFSNPRFTVREADWPVGGKGGQLPDTRQVSSSSLPVPRSEGSPSDSLLIQSPQHQMTKVLLGMIQESQSALKEQRGHEEYISPYFNRHANFSSQNSDIDNERQLNKDNEKQHSDLHRSIPTLNSDMENRYPLNFDVIKNTNALVDVFKRPQSKITSPHPFIRFPMHTSESHGCHLPQEPPFVPPAFISNQPEFSPSPIEDLSLTVAEQILIDDTNDSSPFTLQQSASSVAYPQCSMLDSDPSTHVRFVSDDISQLTSNDRRLLKTGSERYSQNRIELRELSEALRQQPLNSSIIPSSKAPPVVPIPDARPKSSLGSSVPGWPAMSPLIFSQALRISLGDPSEIKRLTQAQPLSKFKRDQFMSKGERDQILKLTLSQIAKTTGQASGTGSKPPIFQSRLFSRNSRSSFDLSQKPSRQRVPESKVTDGRPSAKPTGAQPSETSVNRTMVNFGKTSYGTVRQPRSLINIGLLGISVNEEIDDRFCIEAEIDESKTTNQQLTPTIFNLVDYYCNTVKEPNSFRNALNNNSHKSDDDKRQLQRQVSRFVEVLYGNFLELYDVEWGLPDYPPKCLSDLRKFGSQKDDVLIRLFYWLTTLDLVGHGTEENMTKLMAVHQHGTDVFEKMVKDVSKMWDAAEWIDGPPRITLAIWLLSQVDTFPKGRRLLSRFITVLPWSASSTLAALWILGKTLSGRLESYGDENDELTIPLPELVKIILTSLDQCFDPDTATCQWCITICPGDLLVDRKSPIRKQGDVERHRRLHLGHKFLFNEFFKLLSASFVAL